jgi:raffinose synthase
MRAYFSPPRAPRSVRVKRDVAARVAHYLVVPSAASESVGAPWDLRGAKAWCALHRAGLCWSDPRWGEDPAAIPAETQCLIWRTTGRARHVLLPLYAGEHRATFEPTPGGPALRLAGGLPGAADAGGAGVPVVAAVYACGRDTATALRRAFEAAREVLGTFRLREEKARPEFLGLLGWCTWDAFYHTLSAAKVRGGLASFSRGGVTPSFLMLDDGWLDVSGDHLNGFAADAKKFPGGLAPTIREARRRGVRRVGVWHALQGYWAGLAPDGALARDYRLDVRTGNIRPWNPGETRELARVVEADVARFFQDFHRYLRAQGVDWVKVDGQAALECFTDGRVGRVGATRRWQEALQGAAAAHFGGGLLHCMCNVNDIALHLGAGNAWRNSDDYFPRRGADQQWRHLVFNAYNPLWSSQFAWPDWDMFQSHGPEAAAHAAARALSGGPVYGSDHPGRQDFALLRRIALKD